MASEHGIPPGELRQIEGSGLGGRLTRADLEIYLQKKSGKPGSLGGNTPVPSGPEAKKPSSGEPERVQADQPSSGEPERVQADQPSSGDPARAQVENPSARASGTPGIPSPVISREQIYGTGPSTVEEMDRIRKRIADHMVYSKNVAPHVTSFVESDLSELVGWRNGIKDLFEKKYGERLTLTTLIIEAVVKAMKEIPGINISVDGYKIIRKEEINIGMATALPDGNLIVPVIRNADRMSLAGLARTVNDLAGRARKNKLLPPEIQGGTFTVTNLGQFGNISGTPVINQPEVAILAVGTIRKVPAVVQTPDGDAIGIRHMAVLSLAYDHRVVDGALGGLFLKRIGDNLQHFDPGRSI
jgi:2-oxoglutarate dehydrogenase E2 component (dihydrolipoamide succinyltransferase)